MLPQGRGACLAAAQAGRPWNAKGAGVPRRPVPFARAWPAPVGQALWPDFRPPCCSRVFTTSQSTSLFSQLSR
jgi:hypothetical protein